jgi:hypothetical protein
MPQRSVPEIDPALAEEFRSLAAQVAEQRQRSARLRALAEHAERDERMLAEIEAAVGPSAQTRIEDIDPRLRGRRLEEIAVGLLRRSRRCRCAAVRCSCARIPRY